MKRIILILSISFFAIHTINACTTFVLKNGKELVFGRNLDWVSDNGLVVINKRNVSKTSLVFPPERSLQWTSKYGSVTFNQFGAEFPFGGINEKGLVVEIMLAKADYPKLDNRPAVNELQWIQYHLDCSKTIDEVIESSRKIRISKVQQELHFLICDKEGNVAVIEFRNNKMLVFKGEDLPVPVLENDVYKKSLKKQKNNTSCRFATASEMIDSYTPKDNVSITDYSFKILDEVALDGAWSIVYDIANMKIQFKTASDRNIKSIDINAFDFSCDQPRMLYDLKNPKKGKVNPYFVAFSEKLNRDIMKDAMKTNTVLLPEEILSYFYNYSETCICS